MRRFLPLLAALLLPLSVLGQDIAPSVSFRAERATYKAGEEIKGTVTATFAPGFHGYQNPPSKDYMLAVKVTPGEGTVVKSVAYPKGHMEMAGGEEAAVYSGTVSFPIVIAAPSGNGKVKLNLGFFYQQCDAQVCYMPTTIPISAEVTIEVAKPVDGGPKDPNGASNKAPRFARFTAGAPTAPIKVGENYTVVLRISAGDGLVLFNREGVTGPVTVSEALSVEAPTGRAATIGGQKGRTFSGITEIPMVFKAPDTPGEKEIKLTIEYTQSDSKQVYAPQRETFSFIAEFVAPDVEIPNGSVPTPVKDVTPSQPSTGSDDGLLGFLNNALEEGNWGLIVPAALLAGLALCLTPCVFPMIPVTVTFFSNQGSKSVAGRFSLGFFYAMGIAITYGVVGGIAAASKSAVGALFTKPWFVVGLGLLLIVLALSMFDVYEIRLPSFIQRNLKGRSGPVGALIMGLLMGFAAAPCAGALVGAVAVKVADIGSIPTGLGMFGLIGLGMGLPFMVLATVSSGAKGLPKSGGWLKTTKAVLGLVVLFFAFDYIFKGVGLRTGEDSTNIAWLVIFGGFILYLLFFDKSEPSKAVTSIKGAAAAGIGIFAGMTYAAMNAAPTALNWVPYNEQTFEQAVASGKPIMIDGKADWCVQCREIEHGVFQTPEGVAALKNVFIMSIDWSTGVDQAYIDETKTRFNILGLPHIVFMKPGGKDEFAVKDIKSVEELRGYLRKSGASL